MIAWQITSKNEITKTNVTENLENVDDVKVKITKCFVTRQDISTYKNFTSKNSPIIPGQVAVGLITENLVDSNYFKKNTKVYIAPEKPCKTCSSCLSGNEDECRNVQYSAINYNGYLKDFAVVSKDEIFLLPPNVSEFDALFIYDISIALSIIDKLHVEKGEHVAIIGGTLFANILAQVVAYYQAVPIIIDDNEENLKLAKKCGVYYVSNSQKVENDIISITGGRKCRKIVYVTESNISFDVIETICAKGAEVGVCGSFGSKSKLNIDIGLFSNLTIKFITSGYGNFASSINLLTQKAVNLVEFNIPEYKFDYINKQFEKFSTHSTDESQEFIVNLM